MPAGARGPPWRRTAPPSAFRLPGDRPLKLGPTHLRVERRHSSILLPVSAVRPCSARVPVAEHGESGPGPRMAQAKPDASPWVPASRSLRTLKAAAAGCRGCPLHAPATQTVFGEGPREAHLMLVGEMPGDQEDRAGHVFVGPAGRELDRALAAAGIVRADAYITNAVKNLKFEERGKRRIHSKPSRWEVRACN